jgi:hypothetical protein
MNAEGTVHMKYTASGQASPDIAPEGVFYPMAGRILEVEGENRGLDVSACLRDGKIMLLGGGYEKCQTE